MKKTWTINSGEAVHNVVYCRNIFGRAKIAIDEDVFPLGYVGIFCQRTEPFRVGDYQCLLIMKGRRVRIESNDCEVALV
ncbi:MAG: hypothetical protein SO125_00290 [Eubacteriales bacterium]|nr:hypothetical protein [Eubacteriales bacterium]MDY4897386.1 hypothetical protein [Eubacteriales bacterium]